MRPVPIAGLKSRILHAGFWTLGAYGAEAIIRLATSLILAKLLFPEAFGVMAIVNTIPAALIMLSDIGIRSSIIRRGQALDTDFLRTAWTVQTIRGLVLWLIVVIMCLLLGLPAVREWLPPDSALADPLLPWLLATTTFVLVLAGLQSANIYVHERDIHVRQVLINSVISKIVPLPFIVIIAYSYHSVWAMVVGALISALTSSAASHLLLAGRPMRFAWHVEHARTLLADGKWIAFSSANNLLISQGDRLALSVLMTAGQLGLYSIAWMLLDALRSFLQRLISQLTLPILSELYRTKPGSAVASYYRFRRPIDAAAFATAGVLMGCGPAIVGVLYGGRYADSGIILQILALSLVTLPFGMTLELFLANNQVRTYGNLATVASTCFVGAIFLGNIIAGWHGVVWGIALYRWPQLLLAGLLAYRRGWILPLREITMLPLAGLGAAIGFAVNLALKAMGVWP